MEGALLESLKIVFARLRSLEAVLGGRLNESIIPSEAEAEADPQLAAIRARQLARLKTWDNRAALLAAAEQSAAAVDRVLTAPRGEGLSPELAAMLERAAAEVVERFEAARAAIDPDAKPLELPDLFGAPIPADENRSLPPRTPVKPLEQRKMPYRQRPRQRRPNSWNFAPSSRSC